MGMETLLGIPIRIGLSAACGFRVFVPLLVMNLASLTGHLQLGPGFEWLDTPLASHYTSIGLKDFPITEKATLCHRRLLHAKTG